MLETPYEQLLLSAGQVFITDPCDDSADGFLEEDAHVDGGAGVLHIGLTLYGRRNLVVWMAGGSERTVEQTGGRLWLANSSSFRHQARHLPSEEGFKFGALGDNLSLSVQIRSCTFPFDHSRLAGRTPSPPEVFRDVSQTITNCMADHASKLELPALLEVEAAEVD